MLKFKAKIARTTSFSECAYLVSYPDPIVSKMYNLLAEEAVGTTLVLTISEARRSLCRDLLSRSHNDN